VADAARDPAGLAAEMGAASRPSQLHALLRKRTPEAIALARAHGAEEAERRWRDELRDVRLEIGGDDLIAAGIPAGPEIGRRLDAALARKLDEGVSGREAELAAALDAERP
jgi:tRNA nucleotidyltransferase (CCA-adding enzyme)